MASQLPIDKLPQEVLSIIFHHLVSTGNQLSLVCRRLHCIFLDWFYSLPSGAKGGTEPGTFEGVLVRPSGGNTESLLTTEQVAQFRANGFLVIRDAVERLKYVQPLLEAVGKLNITRTGGTVNLIKFKQYSIFEEYCYRSCLPRLASELLDSDHVYFYFDHLIIKEPNSPTDRTNWHNDQPYWPVVGEHVISFWLALDDVVKENGALQFIKGSHHWSKSNHFIPSGISGSDYKNQQIVSPDTPLPSNACLLPPIDDCPQQYPIEYTEMNSGDIVAFYGTTVHGADGNHTPTPRRAYSIRYCGNDAYYSPFEGALPFLLNGVDNAMKPVGMMAIHPLVFERHK